MSELAQVPGWFWVALAAILAVGAAVAGVLRAGVWRWRYQHKHRVTLDRPTLTPGKQTSGFLPAAVATVPVAVVNGKPPWDLAEAAWSAADLAALHDTGQRPRGMTEPPELGAEDLGPGAGTSLAGYNSHLPTGGQEGPEAAQVNPDAGQMVAAPRGAGEQGCGPLISLPAPTRLASATDVALARCDAFMARMVADHKQWLADARERWAAA